MPKVSVIILTYNRAELLRSAIASVLNQTFQDFEIIVVDDCSTENNLDIVRGFNDVRIKYIRHEVNKGEPGARNTGVANSNAEYLAFLDDDDEWLPEKLRLQVDLLQNSQSKVGGVYTSYLMVDKTTKKTLWHWIPKKRGDIYKDMFVTNYVGTPSTVMLRKKCFEKVGLFDESLLYPTDYDMWIRISKEFYFEYIEEPLVKYSVHKNRISTNLKVRSRGMETILKKYSQFFALNSKGYSCFYLNLGELYCYNGDIKKGREAFFKAIRLYPYEIRNYFNLGLSILGVNSFRRLKFMVSPRSRDIIS